MTKQSGLKVASKVRAGLGGVNHNRTLLTHARPVATLAACLRLQAAMPRDEFRYLEASIAARGETLAEAVGRACFAGGRDADYVIVGAQG